MVSDVTAVEKLDLATGIYHERRFFGTENYQLQQSKKIKNKTNENLLALQAVI